MKQYLKNPFPTCMGCEGKFHIFSLVDDLALHWFGGKELLQNPEVEQARLY